MAIDFPDSPTEGEQYTVGDRTWTWNGTYWQTSTSMSTFTASDTEPVDADPGDIWFDSTIGKTFINYSGTWVEIGNAATVVDVIADADADTKVQVESSADEDKIRFSTAGAERVIVDNAGNVGIGTTSPNYTLEVDGIVKTGNLTIFNDGDAPTLSIWRNGEGTAFIRKETGYVSISALNDAETVVQDIVLDGNVGIGTTSPAKKLHVEGGMLLDAYSVGEDEGLFFREGYTTIDQPSITVWDMTNSGASPDGLSINAQDGIRFRENGGEVARFKDGNFGINDTTPSYALDVNGDINTTGALRTDGKKTGLVLLTSGDVSGGGPITFSSLFSSEFDNYVVYISEVTCTGQNSLYYRMASGGNWAIVNNYSTQRLYVQNTTVGGSKFSSTYATLGFTGARESNFEIHFFSPYLSTQTTVLSREAYSNNTDSGYIELHHSYVDNTTSYDGFVFDEVTGSASISCRYEVYGIPK